MKEKITERDLKNPEYRGFPTEENLSKEGKEFKSKSVFTAQASNQKPQNNLDNKQK